MPVLEEPAGGVELMVQVARGHEHLRQELLDMLTFAAEAGRCLLFGPGLAGVSQPGECQAPLVIGPPARRRRSSGPGR